MRPRLVTVAHGTRDQAGTHLVEALASRVAERLPDVEVVATYVELARPTFASAMRATRGTTVVVPLLLSTGHHMTHDLPKSAELSRFPVMMAGTLGPDPLLADAAAARLQAAGAAPEDAVVMAVAGSRDPEATTQAVLAARMLQRRWDGPVRLAFLSGSRPGVPEVTARLRAHGFHRVALSPYLLAPGYFAGKAAAAARAHGVSTVADPLGGHPLVEDLVVRRYVEVLSRAA